MGEPATPTPVERAGTQRLCAAIVESVKANEVMPLPFAARLVDFKLRCDTRDVEDLAFRLALEVELLRAELGEMRGARDEACDLAERCIDESDYPAGGLAKSRRADIAVLRKVGAL